MTPHRCAQRIFADLLTVPAGDMIALVTGDTPVVGFAPTSKPYARLRAGVWGPDHPEDIEELISVERIATCLDRKLQGEANGL